MTGQVDARSRMFRARLAGLACVLLILVQAIPVVRDSLPPVVDTVLPHVATAEAASPPCSNNAGDYPLFTGKLSDSAGTTLTTTTSGQVYGRVTNIDQSWNLTNCYAYRYDALIWAKSSSTSDLRVDWGLLAGDGNACRYTVGTADYVHKNAGGCPGSPTTARLVAQLTPEAVYTNNAALNTKGQFSFAHSDCFNRYGGTTGEVIIDPVSTSVTDGRPGANCGNKTLDGTGTSQSLTYDHTGPTGTVAIAGGATYTTSTTVSLALTYSDLLSTVTNMQFSNDNTNWGAWLAVAPSASWTLTAGDGTKTVYARFRDSLGNVGSVVSSTIILDTTPPGAVTVTTPTAALSFSNLTTFATAWSAVSGASTYDVLPQSTPLGASAGTCGTSWTNGTQTNQAGLTYSLATVTDATCYRLVVRAVDGAGLQGPWTNASPILVDRTVPGIPVITSTPPASAVQSGATIYFRPSGAGTISLTSTGSDPQSDVASSSFGALSSTTGWTYTPGTVTGNPAAKSLTWSSSATATTSVGITTANNVGDASGSQVITFQPDTVGPVATFTTPPSGTTQGSTSITPAWTEADTRDGTNAGAGVGSTRSLQRYMGTQASGGCQNDWALDGAAYTGASPAATQTLQLAHCYQWRETLIDAVGNTAISISGTLLGGSTPTVAVTDNTGSLANAFRSANTIYVGTTAGGSVQLTATGTDGASTITSNTFTALSGTPIGWSPSSAQSGSVNPYSVTYTWTTGSPSTTTSVTTTNAGGTQSSATVISLTADGIAPTVAITAPASGISYAATASFSVGFAATEAGSGFTRTGAGWSLQRQIAPATNGTCGAFVNDPATGNLVTGQTNATGQTSTQTLVVGSAYRWLLSAADSVGNAASATSGCLIVDSSAPVAPTVTSTAPAGSYRTGNTIFVRPAAGGTVTLTSTGADSESGIASSTFGALSASTGWTYTSGLVSGNPAAKNLTWSASVVSATLPITTANNAGLTSATTTITFTADATAPTTAFSVPAGAPGTVTTQSATTLAVTWAETETGSGVATRSLQRWGASATAATQCATASYATIGAPLVTGSPVTEAGLGNGMCYQWRETLTDNVGNTTTTTSANVFVINPAPPAPSVPDLDAASDSGPIIEQDSTIQLRPNGDALTSGTLTYVPSGTNAWSLIDEASLDTTDYVSLSNSSSFFVDFANGGLAASDVVHSITINFYSNVDAYSPDPTLEVRNPSTGTTYVVGVAHNQYFPPNFWQYRLLTRPWDNQPWTAADIDGLQIGYRAQSAGTAAAIIQLWVDVDYTTLTSQGSAFVSDNVTTDNTPSFNGTSDVTATSVELYDGATLVGTDTTVSSGTWNITASTLADGVHSMTAKAVSAGGSSPASQALSITLDTTAPAAPSVPDLDNRADTGASNTDNITDARSPNYPNVTNPVNTGHFVNERDALSPTIIGNTVTTPTVSWTFDFSGYSGRVSTGLICNDGGDYVGRDHTTTGLTYTVAWPLTATSCYIYSWVGGFGAGPYDVTGGTYTYHDPAVVNSFAFLGTGPSDAKTVTLYDGATLVGGDDALGVGTTYAATPIGDLTVGSHTLTTRAYDLAGNVSAASSPLAISIVGYLPALRTSAPETSVVGATTYVTAATLDETGQPIDNLVGTTLTISSDDPGAQYPLGTTYQLTPSDGEIGRTFKVLFSTPGVHTVTVSAPNVVSSTDQIAVAPEALRAAAPATVYQGIPFKFAVMPRVTSKTSGAISKAYGARITLSSSDSAASFGPEVNGSNQYTFICNCDGAHTFATSVSALGSQTLTVSDQFGATDTVSVDVLPAPGGGVNPISRIDALQWPQGNFVDYYITATGGYQLLSVSDSCGLSNRPLSDSGDSPISSGASLARLAADPNSSFNAGVLPPSLETSPYNSGEIKFSVDAGLCGPGGFGENTSYTFIYTDGLGHVFSIGTTGPWRTFGDIPGNANFAKQGPDSPIVSWSILSRGGTGAASFTDATTGAQVLYSPNAITARFTTLFPTTIYKFQVVNDGLGSLEFGADMEMRHLPSGTSTIALDDTPFFQMGGCSGYRTSTAGHIFFAGPDGRRGALSGGLGFLGPTVEPPPPTWPCDTPYEGQPNPPDPTDPLRDAMKRLGLDDMLGLADAANAVTQMTGADPVDEFNGGQLGDSVDVSLGGKTPFLTFERHYRSELAELAAKGDMPANLAYTTLGRGWSSNLDWKLAIAPGGATINVRGADGGANEFERRDDGTYGGPAGLKMTLNAAGGGYLLKRTAGDGYRFDGAGKLLAIFDPLGHELTVGYDGNGFVHTMTDAGGRVATVSVNAAGHVTRIDLPDGRYVGFTYSSAGFLASVRMLDGKSMTYVTDRRGRITQIKDPDGHLVLANDYDGRGRVITQLDALGNATHFAYDRAQALSTLAFGPRGDVTITCFNPDGTKKAALDPMDGATDYSYNEGSQLTSSTDETGARTRYGYNAVGDPTSIKDPLDHTSAVAYDTQHRPTVQTGVDGSTSTTAYDPTSGLPTSITRADASHSLEVTHYTYNTAGQPLTISEPGGATTTLTYDSAGYLHSSTDAMGRKTTFVTDARGLVTSSVDPLGNATGGVPADHTTTYTYDDAGRRTSIMNPLHETTSYTFDSMGRQLTTTTPLGAVSTAVYDLAGRVVSVTTTISPGVTALSTNEYDAAGNLTATVDAENRRVEMTYDLNGRKTTTKDANLKVWTQAYDPHGRVIKTTDPTSRSSTSAYDAAGRLTSDTDAAGVTRSYGYWPTGELKTVTDALGRMTTYHYDWLGRQDSVTNAKNEVASADYNNAGDAISVTNARTKSTAYVYNLAHQLTKTTEPGSIDTLLAYDAGGRLHTRTNARTSVETYDYDALGRPTQTTDLAGKTWQTVYDADGRVDHTIDGKGQTTAFTYDKVGDVLTATPATGPAISYAYDKTGRLNSMVDGTGTTTYSYDPVGSLTAVTHAGRTTAYTYDPAGRRTSVVYPAGQGTVAYAYDAGGRLSTITDWATRVTTYTYDAVGRVATLTRPGNLLTVYGYDELGRPLTVTNTRNGSGVLAQGYTYDADGNIATLTDDTGTATMGYDDLDRLTSAAYPAGQNYAYTYDAVGNLLTNSTPAGTRTYAYDLADRITSVGPGTPPDTVAPTVPTAPAAVAVASNQVNLAWTPATDVVGVTRYTISRGGVPIAIVNGTATTFSDFSVAASTAYSYTITASDAAGNTSAVSSVASATTPAGGDVIAPTTPTGLSATAAGAGRINLGWTASTDSVGVTRYTVSRGGTPIASVAGSATTFSDFSVAASTNYSYTVTASDGAGNTSAASSSASATSANNGVPGNVTDPPASNDAGWTNAGNAYVLDSAYATAAPAKNSTITVNFGTFGFDSSLPANATVTGVTVSVTWKVSVTGSNPTLGSQLYVSGVAKGTELTNTTSPTIDTTQTYTVSGLTRANLLNGALTVRVRASRGSSNTAFTASLDLVTVKVDYTTPPPPDTTAPTVPAGLSATANGLNRIDLAWTASTDNIAVHGYKVYRDAAQVGTIPVGTTAFFDTGVTAGLHSYTVAAVDGAGNASAQSASASATATAPPGDATPPSTPTGLSATVNGSSRIDLAWTASTDNIAVHGYKVYRDTVQIGTLPIGTVTFADTGITTGLHTYTVAAVDGAGNVSAQSTSASATAIGGGVATAPTYDDDGNLLTDGTYGNRTYTYDALGRLTGVVAAGATTSYTLDGSGNRLSETVNGTTTAFDLDRSSPTATVLADGTRKYLADAPDAGYELAGTWSSALTDLVGSPLEYVSETGTTTTPVHYDPYGAARAGSADPTGIGFAGEWKNATGLVNLRARSYDPVMARFIGRDTFGGTASAPQTGNRYAYAQNNPFRYTDPSGHFVNAIVANGPILLSLGIQLVPVVGNAYTAMIGITGYDPIAGVSLSTQERAVAIGCALVFGGGFALWSHLGEDVASTARAVSESERLAETGVADASRLGEAGAGTLARETGGMAGETADGLAKPGALRSAAVEVHDLATPSIRHNMSTVALADVEMPQGGMQFFASGSSGRLSDEQVARLIDLGVPEANIVGGRLHAEKNILAALPEGARPVRWGIAWAAKNKPMPCEICEPLVNGIVEGL